MLLLSIFTAILILLVVLFLFFRRFMLIRINGESMYPTFTHGQYRLADKRFTPKYIRNFDDIGGLENRIFIVWSPDGLPIVKRLIKTRVHLSYREYWLEGDNKDNSMDSRQYGYLLKDGFIGEVVGWKEALKRLLKLQ